MGKRNVAVGETNLKKAKLFAEMLKRRRCSTESGLQYKVVRPEMQFPYFSR